MVGGVRGSVGAVGELGDADGGDVGDPSGVADQSPAGVGVGASGATGNTAAVAAAAVVGAGLAGFATVGLPSPGEGAEDVAPGSAKMLAFSFSFTLTTSAGKRLVRSVRTPPRTSAAKNPTTAHVVSRFAHVSIPTAF